MKKYHLFLLTLFFALAGCTDDDSGPLPPETQTGAGTFGCTVNGKNFVDNSGNFNCYYQYTEGGYWFGIGGQDDNSDPQGISLLTKNKTLSEGEVLPLKSYADGNATGVGFFYVGNGEHSLTDGDTYTGELTITRFDPVTRVVSGTFWFDLKHPTNGRRIEIREGRFDTLYGM
jgi:hypothetical protein